MRNIRLPLFAFLLAVLLITPANGQNTGHHFAIGGGYSFFLFPGDGVNWSGGATLEGKYGFVFGRRYSVGTLVDYAFGNGVANTPVPSDALAWNTVPIRFCRGGIRLDLELDCLPGAQLDPYVGLTFGPAFGKYWATSSKPSASDARWMFLSGPRLGVRVLHRLDLAVGLDYAFRYSPYSSITAILGFRF